VGSRRRFMGRQCPGKDCNRGAGAWRGFRRRLALGRTTAWPWLCGISLDYVRRRFRLKAH